MDNNVFSLDQARRNRITTRAQIPDKLRCREGDIVVYVKSTVPQNYGKLGRVARRLSPQEEALYPNDVLHWRVEALGCRIEVTDDEKTWSADHSLAADWELCPLRVELGTDELLRIIGKPKKIRAPKRRTAETDGR